MKPVHYFVVLLFISLVQNQAFSQGQQSTIGVTAGINISNINFESLNPEDTDQYLGYYGGLRAQIPIKGKFLIVSNLIYSRKGWHFDPWEPTGDPGGTMHLDYLDLQLATQYAVTNSLAIDAGVEVGRLLKTTRDPHNDFFDDLYQKGEFGLLIGVSYKIWKSIRLEAKYLHGISHLFKGNVTDSNGNPTNEVFKEGNFGIFQIGISTDIIKLKFAEKQKV